MGFGQYRFHHPEWRERSRDFLAHFELAPTSKIFESRPQTLAVSARQASLSLRKVIS